MPEIPDLENFARNLNKHFKGKKVKKFTQHPGRVVPNNEKELKKALEKNTLKKVYRSGKELRLLFSDKTLLGLHLMLHGDLHIFENKNDNKFTRVDFLFEDGSGLAVTDWQKSANVRLNPEDKEGIDALDKKLNFSYLKKGMQSSATIKNVLRKQEFIRGLGNAYTDEILWKAKINPYSIAKAIPENKIKDLAKSIKSVLNHAIKHIEKNYPDNLTGEIRDFLKVHNTKKEKSPGGFEIKKEKKGGSNTYYTDEQELYM